MRPCFLVVDQEHVGTISSRKLVIETAKMNVITAYSGKEALETLQRFPNVDGIVIDCAVTDVDLQVLVDEAKRVKGRRVLALVVDSSGTPAGCDARVSPYSPEDLLQKLREVCAAETEEIAANERRLAGQGGA